MNNQKGFGLVEAVLIVVVVGLIGGAGWYILRPKVKVPDSTTTESSTPKLKKEFVEIKDWGVRFAVDKPASQYKVGDTINRAGNQIVIITNSVQDAIYKGCGDVVIERGDKMSFYNPASGELQPFDSNQGIKQIGSYYYYANHPQAACFSDDASVHNADGTMNQIKADDYDKLLTAAGQLTDRKLSNLVSSTN